MAKIEKKQYPKSGRNDDTATVVAGLYHVTDRYVRMVMAGERTDDEILAACIEYKAGKNLLVEAVRNLIPFTTKKAVSLTQKPVLNEAN